MWEWHLGSGSGWWIIMPLTMIAFWGGLFWLIASMTREQRSQIPVGNADLDANEIAARRFASGEIDESEYSRISNRVES